MAQYRLTRVIQADIGAILAWSEEEFGKDARKRYEALIATAIRDAVSRTGDVGPIVRPELGDGVFSWHLAQSRARTPGKAMNRPRHFLICRPDGDVLVIVRVLYDAMEPHRYINSPDPWD
ncbi:type II toxin-antitoxin system RelE/ParE family toxin [Cryobacterium sp. Hh11]|uniref:type II toxin-antitoxin system RelE/ParE family toxin n=1 Tax=Cryobacterium sp. Hh11 TaxID=2555868 RepID=UPI0010692E91|nr:type II toxin-antitoxin system RelE/ParE family toxin [Cryobacterium sp. Hh11]TFD52099.1 type II toxin-antitoxin system RelE/ParE family toxin [Cryobacterium sp. Hh11]